MNFQTPETIIKPLLQNDEKLLWSGIPLQGIKLRKLDIFMIPFSIIWGGFTAMAGTDSQGMTTSCPSYELEVLSPELNPKQILIF